nr:unnamed protein product [Callosobruchus chinensis]
MFEKRPSKGVKQHIWSENNMLQAVKAVRNKSVGYLMASKTFNVPRATLFRYCQNNGDSLTLNKQRLGRKPVLSEELEKKLVEYLIMDKNYFGLTRRDVRSVAYQLAKQNNIPNSFSLNHQTAGKDWLKRFLKRHERILSVRKPTGTSLARAVGFS